MAHVISIPLRHGALTFGHRVWPEKSSHFTMWYFFLDLSDEKNPGCLGDLLGIIILLCGDYIQYAFFWTPIKQPVEWKVRRVFSYLTWSPVLCGKSDLAGAPPSQSCPFFTQRC